MQLTDRFRSTTLILVTPQKVPTNFVASTVTTGIQERLQTISQQIFSRTRLEQIITEFDLFADEKEKITPEEIVELMRQRIALEVKRENSFRLSFVDPNPRMAMLVTNKLASLFIQENLKVREQQAVGTSQFLGSEIERYREFVREKEKKIFEFKQLHINEMPEQTTTNASRLNQLQRQLEINNQNINAAKDRRVQIQLQVAEIERRLQEEYEARRKAVLPPTEKSSAPVLALEPIFSPIKLEDMELSKLQDELAALKLSRTEQHPDVVKLLTKIKAIEEKNVVREGAGQELESLLSRIESESQETPVVPTEPVQVERPIPPPIYDRLRSDLFAVEADIARQNNQNDGIQKEIDIYQARIAATPGRELELKALSEDYNSLKSVLENLVDKKIQADLSENLERKQKGEQFKILDPANLPEKPFAPNRLRLLAAGLILGLGIGPGLVILLDFLSPGVKSAADLAFLIDAPVLVAIPQIFTDADKKKRWLLRGGISASIFIVLVSAVFVSHVKYKPIPQALGDIVAQIKTTHWRNMK